MSSGQTKNKRPRTEETEEEKNEPSYVRIVSEKLRKLMGGVKLCREEELTRDMLLEILKSQGDIRRGEGLGGSDCADNGWGELRSDAGGGRWKQQQCACSESGD
jgi:hypothetical protein